jgi:hypothetical protein
MMVDDIQFSLTVPRNKKHDISILNQIKPEESGLNLKRIEKDRRPIRNRPKVIISLDFCHCSSV